MSIFNSWLHHFTLLKSNNISNKTLQLLALATSPSNKSTSNSFINILTQDIDIAFPYGLSSRKTHQATMHCPHRLGGTRLCPQQILVALNGFEHRAQPLIVNTSTLTTTLSPYKRPRWPQFEHFYLRTQSPPSPLHAMVARPLNVFPETAHDYCKHILSFLWGAKKGVIPPVNIIPGLDNPTLVTWSSCQHHSCLTPIVSSSSNDSDLTSTPPVTANIVQTLAHGVTSQTVVWKKMQQDKQEAKE